MSEKSARSHSRRIESLDSEVWDHSCLVWLSSHFFLLVLPDWRKKWMWFPLAQESNCGFQIASICQQAVHREILLLLCATEFTLVSFDRQYSSQNVGAGRGPVFILLILQTRNRRHKEGKRFLQGLAGLQFMTVTPSRTYSSWTSESDKDF